MFPVLVALGGAGFALYFSNKLYFSGGKCYETGRLDGKLVIVTGANTGIGKETAAELARRGANVIMACRNMDRAEATKSDILTTYSKENPEALTRNVPNSTISERLTPVHPEQLMIEKLDLSSFRSVRTFVDRIREKGYQVDILINNAGIFETLYGKTEDGFERHIGVNHLGPFLLTELLIPVLKRNPNGSRIIFVSSRGHRSARMSLLPLNTERDKYNYFQCYYRSKLANAMYTAYLGRTFKSDGIQTASVHPGVVVTDILRNDKLLDILTFRLGRPFLKTCWEGAQTTLFTALTPNLNSGHYYADCKEEAPHPLVFDQRAQEELVAASRKAVGFE
ncbi:unnamed protein product [Hymenolepis diminuta]|uniref:Retinol dehydrogenase 12 n=1 Tax=Hymenolepis diminuta TaxID=6216 RepID=A0A564YLJ9_HYMDI|nr:unnamed protein product [Hymenolepis diminuta]